MNITSEDIKDMLVAESSLGLVFTNNLFIGREPTKPDDCVTIFDTPGFPPQLTFKQSERYEYPSIQIRIRNKSYKDGLELAQDIKDSLHGRAQETWNGTLYSLIQCSGSPTLLDWDENNRARFIINFNVQRR